MLNKEIIPESFETPEEAGEFWDTHSAADYWDEMEEQEAEFDIRERIYHIPIGEKIYQLAINRAREEDCTVGQVISTILKRALF